MPRRSYADGMGDRLDPSRVLSAIRSEVRVLLGRGDSGDPLDDTERSQLAPALRTLADAYTVERAGPVALSFAEPRLRAAYLAHYGVRSFLVARLIADSYQVDGRAVLELGAGPGTAGLALVEACGSWTAIDREPLLLDLASALGRRLDVNPTTAAAAVAARRWGAGTPSVVLLANTLNEWSDDVPARAALLQQLIDRLAPGGLLVVVEPAVRSVSRQLSALRDALIAAGIGVAGPCTHLQPCPMLQRRRDFCHGRQRLEVPPDLALLGQQAGHFDLADADFSTLVCGRPTTPRLAGWRAVGDVQREKGRDRLFLCGSAGLIEVFALTGAGRPGRECLRSLRRGDVLALDVGSVPRPLRIEQPAPLQPIGWLP